VFGLLKKVMKDHRIRSDEELKVPVVQRFQQQPRDFFSEGTHQPVHQLDACLNVNEDYIKQSLLLHQEKFPNDFHSNNTHISL
jgi:hypothetical protein